MPTDDSKASFPDGQDRFLFIDGTVYCTTKEGIPQRNSRNRKLWMNSMIAFSVVWETKAILLLEVMYL